MNTVDKNVYNIKAEKIQKQVKQGDYETAAKICDGIDWTEVKSTRMLSLVSSVYEHVQRYDTAIDILLMAYEEAQVGKRFLYKLTELALAAGNIKEAEEYYRNYLQEAPDDNSRYILRYLIAEAKHESLDKRITILEAFKSREFDERWSCRLAELYDEAGNGERCVAICDEIILWFGVGPYVDRALELKEKYVPLTEEQLEHRSNRLQYEENLREVQRSMSGDPDEVIPEVTKPEENDVASESGQSVSTLDTSVIEEEEGRYREPDEMTNTRRVSDKDQLTHTRIFEKMPADGSEAKLFRTVTLADEAAPAPAPAPEPAREDEPVQMEFVWDEPEPEKPEVPEIKRVIFVGDDTPGGALTKSLEAVRAARAQAELPVGGIVKISGVKLNGKGVLASLPALEGKDLIVLGASALDGVILDEIRQASAETGKFFVLADSPENIASTEKRYNGEEPAAEPEAEAVAEPETEAVVEPEAEAVAEPETEAVVEPEAEAVTEPEPAAEAETEAPAEDVSEPEPDEDIEPEPADEGDIEIAISEPEAEPEPDIEIAISESPDETYEEKPAADKPAADKPAEEKPAGARRVEFVDDGSLTVEDFYASVRQYMRKIDCVLEDGKEDDLKDYFRKIKKEGEKLTQKLAAEMVEDAADAAEAHSLGNAFHNRYDDDGNLILRPKHFV